MSTQTVYQPSKYAQQLAGLLAQRAELAKRCNKLPTRREELWRELPQWFKRMALKRAGLDPLAECMPLSTFDESDQLTLCHFAVKLADLAETLRKATA